MFSQRFFMFGLFLMFLQYGALRSFQISGSELKNSDGNSSSWNKDFPESQKFCSIFELKGRTSRAKECYNDEKKTACLENNIVGTTAKVQCNPGYYRPNISEDSEIYTCFSDGHWSKKLFDCTPICGKLSLLTLIFFFMDAKIPEYPWSVAVYQNVNNFEELICGGTILTERIVVSAAHCFFKDITSGVEMNAIDSFKVVAGKYYRDFKANETLPVQVFGLTEIIKAENYEGQFGHYNHDIALLVLNKIIAFSPQISPICLDLNSDESQLLEGSEGKIAGWCNTEITGQPSEDLSLITATVVPLQKCKNEATDDFGKFITDDKICAVDNIEAGVGRGYSGAGLVFSEELSSKTFYLRGVVSNRPNKLSEIREGDVKKYALFTNVQQYRNLIEEVYMKYPLN